MAAFRKALLHPASMAGVVPRASIHDDASGRVRAARPMTRAEIASRRTLALVPVPRETPNTFDEGTGAFQTEEDDDLVPARNRSRGVALVSAATLAGVALAAVLTYGDASRDPATALALAPQRPPQRMVPVSFSSDPDGAVITSSDGVKLGTTPLSIEIPAGDAPVVYVFRKEGFLAKAISFIPNIPSPVFAFMQPELVVSARDAGPGPEPQDERSIPRAPRPRPAHRRASAAVEPPPQQPGPSVGANFGTTVGTAVDPAADPNVDGLMPPTFAPLQQ